MGWSTTSDLTGREFWRIGSIASCCSAAGLLLNAAAITLIGVTRRYDLLLLWAVIAGVGGTIFHPAAGALVPAHFPKNPGMAIGLLGAGSGLGFFFGPQFAGWRAQSAHWSLSWINIAQWQKPCVEFGIAGIVASMIFQLIATEADVGFRRRISVPMPINLVMKLRVLLIGTVLGCRDFAAIAGFSLAGIYLLRARSFDAKHAGMILGSTMLLSIVTNPLIVWLTPLNRRLPALRGALILAGLVAICIPFAPDGLGRRDSLRISDQLPSDVRPERCGGCWNVFPQPSAAGRMVCI